VITARPASLLAERVGSLVREVPLTCAPSTSVADVAAVMGQRRTRAVIVVGPDGRALGIVTDRDLRARVVAARRDPALTRVADVMSTPVVTVIPSAFAFEALTEMTRREIHHLVVTEDDGRVVGVLGSDDLILLPAAHPVLLAREISRAESREALAYAAASITALVHRLVASGVRAADVAGIVAELNDRLVIRVVALAEASVSAAHGRAPVPYCWLAFGSEGRREQTLRTDQDNGLVYADPGAADTDACAQWFGRLADEAIAGLVAVGFPLCPGGAMASNRRWCQPFTTWASYFTEWMDRPVAEHILNACMYFDLRPVAGTPALGRALRDLLREETPKRKHFLSALARDVASRRLPFTMFGRLAAERWGPHRGTLDIKGAGSLQLVGAGRVWALDLGLVETNTIARLRAAGGAGLLPAEEATAAAEAYGHLLHLRLEHQLEALEMGAVPDNRVTPARLSRHDVTLLRESLRTVGVVQAHLRDRYRTDLLG
jgi:CBS domain-containing protein